MIKQDNYIRTEQYEMYIEDGILFARYLKPTIVDLETSKKVLEDRESLCNGEAYAILGDSRLIKYWTREAMNFHNSEEYSRSVKAVAVVFNSHVLTVLLNFFTVFHKSVFPIRSFSNDKDAIQWLKKYK